MNRSLTVITKGVNWRDGQGVLTKFLEELLDAFQAEMERRLQAQLETETDALLGRESHQRRVRCGRRASAAVCLRCGSRRQRDFVRNGHRSRTVNTTLGQMEVWYPRAVCQCGGSVELPLSLLERYQRFFGDVDAQIAQYARWGISLRQMQSGLSEMLSSSVGLHRLNRCVQAVRQPIPIPLTRVTPILLLDAIWLTVLRPTGEQRHDRHGRLRAVKRKVKVALLVALGVWPSGEWHTLEWSLAEGETTQAWEALLVGLEARGMYAERGLSLIIHDGNAALMSVLQQIYPRIPHQCCLFHKLRNLWQAIVVPEDLPKADAKAFKSTLMKTMRSILNAPFERDALRLRDEFCRQWATTQPKLVTTLLRDWHETVAFFRLRLRFPDWSLLRLRTTSLLERVNRMLRRSFRAAGAFHSDTGVLAAAARILLPFRAV
jgi:transposase-like protein